jgi:transposase-like protein
MADPKHPRHYDEAFKRQIVQSCESGKPSREIRAECDIARSTPRRWVQGIRDSGSARAERAGRAGEARQAVGDGGGRFRTSGAGIRTKAGVTRAYEAKLANLAS